MKFFLENGQLEGKIMCPNKKCGAKLGNYDWAGVCCSCKEWVVPVRALVSVLRCVLTGRVGFLYPSVQGRRDRVVGLFGLVGSAGCIFRLYLPLGAFGFCP
jgi:hypothetical protein